MAFPVRNPVNSFLAYKSEMCLRVQRSCSATSCGRRILRSTEHDPSHRLLLPMELMWRLTSAVRSWPHRRPRRLGHGFVNLGAEFTIFGILPQSLGLANNRPAHGSPSGAEKCLSDRSLAVVAHEWPMSWPGSQRFRCDRAEPELRLEYPQPDQKDWPTHHPRPRFTRPGGHCSFHHFPFVEFKVVEGS